MSLRRHILRAVGLLTAVAMVFGALAGTAVAKKASHKQKVRAQLLRAVKKNPRIVTKKSFLKKASLVNFTLPVTIRLRGTNQSTPTSALYDQSFNPNSATVNLGASLGNRQVSLGGSLPAEVQFNDAFDGGALGNVRLAILEGGTGLTTTSIPLLWNANTNKASRAWWGIGFDGPGNPLTGGTDTNGEFDDGCGGFVGTADLPATPLQGASALGSWSPAYVAGIPYFTATANPPSVIDPSGKIGNALNFQGLLQAAQYTAAGTFIAGYVAEVPGVDGLTRLRASGQTTSGAADALDPSLALINQMGLNPDPFPIPFNDPLVNTNTNDPNFDPLASTSAPNIQTSVLRTAPINLTVAHAGTLVTQTDDTLGVDGSQNIVIGKSGGQANLFGNIPGRGPGYGIDVTVSLGGRINSILRAVDEDNSALINGVEFPPAAFECRQA